MTELLYLLFGLFRSLLRRRDSDLLLENLALRHQLQVALRSNRRPRLLTIDGSARRATPPPADRRG